MNKRINQISFGDLFSTSTISQASYENRLKKHPSDLCLESSSQGVASIPQNMSSFSQQMDTFDSQNSQMMSSQQQLVGSSQKAVRKAISDDGNREHHKGYSSFNSAVQQQSSSLLKTLGQPQQQLTLCRARIEEVEERESMDVILSQMKNYSSEIKQIRVDLLDNLEQANVLSNNVISKYSENVKTILDNQLSELSILLKTPSKSDSSKDGKLFAKLDELKNVLEKQSSSLVKLTKTVESNHKQTTNSFKSMKKEVDDSLCQYAAELTGILRTFITRIEEKLSSKADDIISCLCDKWSSNSSSQSKSVSDMEVQVDSLPNQIESNEDSGNLMSDKMDSDSADAETVPGSPQEDSLSLCLTPSKFLNGSNNQPMVPYNDSAFYSEVISTNIIQDHEYHCPVINLSTKNGRPSKDDNQIGMASFYKTVSSPPPLDCQATTPLDLSMQKLSLDGYSDRLPKSKCNGCGQRSPQAYSRSGISPQIDYCSGGNHDGYSNDNNQSPYTTTECRDELSCLVDTNVFLSVNNVCEENTSVRGSLYKTVKKTVVCWENSSRQNQVAGRQVGRQLSPRTPIYSTENNPKVHFDGSQQYSRNSRPQPPPPSNEFQLSFQGQAASDSKVLPNQPCRLVENDFSNGGYLKRPALARIENQVSTVSRSTESFQRRRSGAKTKRRSKVICQRIGNKRKSTFRSDPSFRYDDDYEDSDKENVDPKFLTNYPTGLNFPRRSKRKIELLSTAEDEFSWTSTSTKSSSEAN